VSARVTVVGAGSWGTSIAALLAGKGHDVILWAFEEEVAREVNEERRNGGYLPDIELPNSLRATAELHPALEDREFVISVSPSQFVRSVMKGAEEVIDEDAVVISASKGIELDTRLRMDQVLGEILSPAQMQGFTVLSGPSFAGEVARGVPTAVVVASRHPTTASRVQRLFQTEYFRVYTNPDVIGVELGGALKNVIALAAGVAAGLELGHNTRAALITRGLAEIKRLGMAMGAQPATFSGLAGMGDLVLTCTGELSRNRTVGYRLGQGESLEEILSEMTAVAEGVKTAESVRDLAADYGVEMPITEQVYAMLVKGKAPRDALRTLMERSPKPEEWS